jgi:K+ transporter
MNGELDVGICSRDAEIYTFCVHLCLYLCSQGISAVFSPIMFIWFVAIAGIGIYNIQSTRNYVVLSAFNPSIGIELFK